MASSEQSGGFDDPAVDTTTSVFDRTALPSLLEGLRLRGYTIVGPTVRGQAIVYDEIAAVSDLPIGMTDMQEAGTYRLQRRHDEALFGYTVGPHSWKRFLHPPQLRLWSASRDGTSFHVEQAVEDAPKYAFLGVRACELAAIAVQDRVFIGGTYVDPHYAVRRERACLIAVNCGQAGATCFCTSMGTGPRATAGYDLCLTEVLDGERHYFVAEPGTELGRELLAGMPCRSATEAELDAACRVSETAVAQMGRTLDTHGIAELLIANSEHPRWDDVANRCLTCGNCTAVCPTCFCTTVEDTTDMSGEHAERWRRWDSCFTLDFSYIAGGSIRTSARSRYRQWMTHKLATWYEQFGSSGCVGCGRCITWCPAAIDITEEARVIRASVSDPKPEVPS
jgi:ferredoxin